MPTIPRTTVPNYPFRDRLGRWATAPRTIEEPDEEVITQYHDSLFNTDTTATERLDITTIQLQPPVTTPEATGEEIKCPYCNHYSYNTADTDSFRTIKRYGADVTICWVCYCNINLECSDCKIVQPSSSLVSSGFLGYVFIPRKLRKDGNNYYKYFCGTCKKKNAKELFKCGICNNNILNKHLRPASGEAKGSICVTCYDDKYQLFNCSGCKKDTEYLIFNFKYHDYDEFKYCYPCLRVTPGSFFSRSQILELDYMYTCNNCKKPKDPIKEGGVYVEGKNECHQCYKKLRAGNKNHKYGVRVFPKSDRDRGYSSFEKPLKFFTDSEKAYAHVGIEVETESGLFLRPDEISDRVMAIKADGSISSWGMELLTQPSSGKELLKTIDDIFGQLKKNGFTGSTATGMHNHVDFGKASLSEVKKLFLLGYMLEPFIESKVPANRRNGQFCRSLHTLFTFDEVLHIASKDTDKLFYSAASNTKGNKRDMSNYSPSWLQQTKRGHGSDMRYTGLNMHSVFFRGTIEFRYPHTVIDETYAKSTALFFASIVEYARSDKFRLLTASKLGPIAIAKKKFNKELESLTGEQNKEVYSECAQLLFKEMNTPSMEMLRSINPDYLKP